MEFAAAALTSIASTVGTVSASSGGFLAGLGTTSTWASILSGGATVASVLVAARAGQQQAENYMMQASDAETSAALESVQGLERRNSIKASLLQAIGERDVAAGASGIDLSFGTPAIARDQAQKDAANALEADQNTETFRRSRLFERAASYRSMAREASAGGLGKAAAMALEGGVKMLRRG